MTTFTLFPGHTVTTDLSASDVCTMLADVLSGTEAIDRAEVTDEDGVTRWRIDREGGVVEIYDLCNGQSETRPNLAAQLAEAHAAIDRLTREAGRQEQERRTLVARLESAERRALREVA